MIARDTNTALSNTCDTPGDSPAFPTAKTSSQSSRRSALVAAAEVSGEVVTEPTQTSVLDRPGVSPAAGELPDLSTHRLATELSRLYSSPCLRPRPG